MKYFIEFKDRGKKSWFRIVHKNGNIITTSEMYTRKAARSRVANNLSKATGIPVKTD